MLDFDPESLSPEKLAIWKELQANLQEQEQELESESIAIAKTIKQSIQIQTDYNSILIEDSKLSRVFELYIPNPYKRGLEGKITLDDWFASIRKFEIILEMMKQLDISTMIQNKQIARAKFTPIGNVNAADL